MTRAMTPEAKAALSRTIRALRERLLADLRDAVTSTYRLEAPLQHAELGEAAYARRRRLDAWVDEQVRASTRTAKGARTRDALLRDAEKQAAYTLLNRLVLLRLLEAPAPGDGAPVVQPAVLKGGWNSLAYRQFKEAAPALCEDATAGYATLLGLVFDELALDLPGLFGATGVVDLIPVPAATLRAVVDALNTAELETCWTDDMTLGWVYQYWNDPEREALDAKLNAGGKVAPHEIASKTQMFTERYMVDWLLQNTVNPLWLRICARNGWTPHAHARGTLEALETRRTEWRALRALGPDNGGVALTALMPLHTADEHAWAYYLAPAGADGAGDAAPDDATPDSLRDIRLIDPAVGSGHFLVVALDLLFRFLREERAHRGLDGEPAWSDRALVEHILSHTLHGIDLDARAVQIAAASLWLKAQHLAGGAHPSRLNLVASNLRLAQLSDDDPSLVALRNQLEREAGIPAALTDELMAALRGADHLGSLLKVGSEIDRLLTAHEAQLAQRQPDQVDLFAGAASAQPTRTVPVAEARATLLHRLERFLAAHTHGDDLGLRLAGEQLAAGVRFVRMVQESRYDIVVANPPYQGTSKIADDAYVKRHYPLGKADLYAAFLLRGLELVKEGGTSAMLTMRNWMFIKQYAELRRGLFESHGLSAIGDFDRGAFEEIAAGPGGVSVAATVWRRISSAPEVHALRPSPIGSTRHDLAEKRAATLCHVDRFTFDPRALKVVPEWPLVYWWDDAALAPYRAGLLIGNVAPAKPGLATQDNERFLRLPSEVLPGCVHRARTTIVCAAPLGLASATWLPYVKGGAGSQWFEPLSYVVRWEQGRLELCVFVERYRLKSPGAYIKNTHYYYKYGVAVAPVGAVFSARLHRWQSVLGHMGTSCFGAPYELVCWLNTSRAIGLVQDLCPGVHFSAGDVNKLPASSIGKADAIVAQLDTAFTTHESHREPSVEFLHPGPSPWRYAQDWAQRAVDRPDGDPLPPYDEELDAEPPTDHVSYALGVALGRFHPDGTGIVDATTDDLQHALPAGILFLDGSLADDDPRDGLGHTACTMLRDAWAEHGPAIDARKSLRDYLAGTFFKSVHRQMYDNKPIHWPLSSERKTFVAWVTIHRMSEQTLPILLADHLHPARQRLQGRLDDLRTQRDAGGDTGTHADKRLATVRAWLDELEAFIALVEQCAYRGAPPARAKATPRAQDAAYAPVLDDGVMINSAALWPLLDPQWNKPKQWWGELCEAANNKDYDWSHLAMRYWPERVDAKCQADPSLGVAHGCFWRYHPARAWAWELRLQDEIGPDFRIEEAPYAPLGLDLAARPDTGDAAHRNAYLASAPDEALQAVEKEALRRMGRGDNKQIVDRMTLLEAGLWSARPAAAYALEDRLSEKQGAVFVLDAPDAEAARSAYEAQEPAATRRRSELHAGFEERQGVML